jgi:hypothetical protein
LFARFSSASFSSEPPLSCCPSDLPPLLGALHCRFSVRSSISILRSCDSSRSSSGARIRFILRRITGPICECSTYQSPTVSASSMNLNS